MAMYSATDGVPNEFHLVHLGSRAMGGAGMVFGGNDLRVARRADHARMSRALEQCPGRTVAADRRFHSSQQYRAKSAIQLGHAGRKGSTRVAWEGMDQPLADENWPLIAPTALSYLETAQMPREMTRADMERVVRISSPPRAAPRQSDSTGSNFIAPTDIFCPDSSRRSPIAAPTNMAARSKIAARYPLEVFAAIRAVWPA